MLSQRRGGLKRPSRRLGECGCAPPWARAAERPRISALYSATLLVASPMYSPISSTTFQRASEMAMPIAAGPGFPREAPSTCSTRFTGGRLAVWTTSFGKHQDAAAAFARQEEIFLLRKPAHPPLGNRHVTAFADTLPHRGHGDRAHALADPIVAPQQILVDGRDDLRALPPQVLERRSQRGPVALVGFNLPLQVHARGGGVIGQRAPAVLQRFPLFHQRQDAVLQVPGVALQCGDILLHGG